MSGKACILGMSVTVEIIMGQISAGRSIDELLVVYSYRKREDIMQALLHAAWQMKEREVVLISA